LVEIRINTRIFEFNEQIHKNIEMIKSKVFYNPVASITESKDSYQPSKKGSLSCNAVIVGMGEKLKSDGMLSWLEVFIDGVHNTISKNLEAGILSDEELKCIGVRCLWGTDEAEDSTLNNLVLPLDEFLEHQNNAKVKVSRYMFMYMHLPTSYVLPGQEQIEASKRKRELKYGFEFSNVPRISLFDGQTVSIYFSKFNQLNISNYAVGDYVSIQNIMYWANGGDYSGPGGLSTNQPIIMKKQKVPLELTVYTLVSNLYDKCDPSEDDITTASERLLYQIAIYYQVLFPSTVSSLKVTGRLAEIQRLRFKPSSFKTSKSEGEQLISLLCPSTITTMLPIYFNHRNRRINGPGKFTAGNAYTGVSTMQQDQLNPVDYEMGNTLFHEKFELMEKSKGAQSVIDNVLSTVFAPLTVLNSPSWDVRESTFSNKCSKSIIGLSSLDLDQCMSLITTHIPSSVGFLMFYGKNFIDSVLENAKPFIGLSLKNYGFIGDYITKYTTSLCSSNEDFIWKVVPLIVHDLKKIKNNESADLSSYAQGSTKKDYLKYVQGLLKFKNKTSSGELVFDTRYNFMFINDENYNVLSNFIPVSGNGSGNVTKSSNDFDHVKLKCLLSYKKTSVDKLDAVETTVNNETRRSTNMTSLCFNGKNERDSMFSRVIFETKDKKIKPITFASLCLHGTLSGSENNDDDKNNNNNNTNLKLLVMRFIVEIFISQIKESEWESHTFDDDDDAASVVSEHVGLSDRYRRWIYKLMPELDVSTIGYELNDTVFKDLKHYKFNFVLNDTEIIESRKPLAPLDLSLISKHRAFEFDETDDNIELDDLVKYDQSTSDENTINEHINDFYVNESIDNDSIVDVKSNIVKDEKKMAKKEKKRKLDLIEGVNSSDSTKKKVKK
jgi:hypothetical protein